MSNCLMDFHLAFQDSSVLPLRSCQVLSELRVETREAWCGAETILGPLLVYYCAGISVASYSADGVLCRIHMPLAVAQRRPQLHLAEYFPIHGDLDLSLWAEMVLLDRIPQTSHVGYEWFRDVVPRSQSVPRCSASWLWLEFFS
jgi:hypothetical protein